MARFSGAARSEGIETHRLEGVEVRIYSVAKPVADCFKYRNKVGIDVAVELARFAGICLVTRVVPPFPIALARRSP